MIVRAGFFMLEYMICVALCALCLYYGAHMWQSLDRLAVRTELDVLAAHCTCMQQEAWAKAQPHVIQFDTYTHTYTCDGSSFALASPVIFGYIPALKGPPGSPHAPITDPITFVGHHMTSARQGILQAGTIYLTNKNHTCQYALSNAVGAFSYMRKYVYSNGWKHIC
ncbi:MAG TPA: hypothetical protein VEK38_02040 [Candidatus Bathyarchaeia archaeon]|nr:hypothetical protein [Candidatus Bathyarchaeia archaeon]